MRQHPTVQKRKSKSSTANWKIHKLPRKDIKVIMGDWKAKIGSDNIGWEAIMQKYGYGERNERRKIAGICCKTRHVHLQHYVQTKRVQKKDVEIT